MHRGVELEERDFFQQPFTRAEVEGLLQGGAAPEMFNFRGPSFKKLGLDKDRLSDDDLIELMLENPRLIKRPVVQIGDRVYFGASAPKLEEVLG